MKSKTFMFDGDDAVEFGLNAAVLLYNFRYWCHHNAANEKHFHQGRYWTYNSRKAFAILFPFLTERQIKTAIKKLEDGGAIVSGEFGEDKWDRTKWYSVTDRCWTNKSTRLDLKVQSHTDINTYNNICPKPTSTTFLNSDGEDVSVELIPKEKYPAEEVCEHMRSIMLPKPFKRGGTKKIKQLLNKFKPDPQAFLQSLEGWYTSEDYTREDGQYAKNICTFIREELWKEEPPQPTKPQLKNYGL